MAQAAAVIKQRIASEGMLFFDEFMRLALYGPGGFFSAGPLRSVKSGDFLTSPEVSPHFGRALGEFARREHAGLGAPAGFRLIEVGAGSGSLLESLLEVCPFPAWAVEVSPPARKALSAIDGLTVVEALDGVPPGSGIVIANELVDNLPMAIAVKVKSGWEEFAVKGRDRLELARVGARAEVEEWADRFGGHRRPGDLVEVQIEACRWMREAAELSRPGTVVVIDYGGTVEELEPRRQTGTLRTYRSHHLGPDPLLSPGESDITADVNFTALAAAAESAGASTEIHRQDDFLSGLGLRDELTRLRTRELELARRGEEMARLRVRSEVSDLETVLHPRGLGDFRVLVARTG